MVEWCESILASAGGPASLSDAARAFADSTRGVDFFCPSYECIPLAPLFLALRNLAGVPVRLLLIAHAAGAYAFEWTLLRPLLVPGDLIIAPSESARATIDCLVPALGPFVRVIAHPIAPLADPRREPPRRGGPRGAGALVSLGRIHAAKLLHRQIEALDVLRARYRLPPTLAIAGAVAEGGWTGTPPYLRALQEKIRRLRLGEYVRFVGPIYDRGEKARFLAHADALVNLSVTVEESFPKAPVEALGVGTPVLGTAWNGLRDTVGAAGRLLPVAIVGSGVGTVDLGAEVVADGIEQLLDAPPAPDLCRAQVDAFRPEVVVPRYRAALTEARDVAAATSCAHPWPSDDEPAAVGGLLGRATVLGQWSWRELLHELIEETAVIRREWTTAAPMGAQRVDRLRAVVQETIRAPLQCFCGGLPPCVTATPLGEPVPAGREAIVAQCGPAPVDRRARFVEAARTEGLLSGRIAALVVLLRMGCIDAVARLLRQLENQGHGGIVVTELWAEVAVGRGDLAEALAKCESSLRTVAPGEAEPQRVRRLARVARQAGRPALALPWLDDWLARFPDSQESGAVWLECGVTAMQASVGASDAEAEAHLERATYALARARTLLGDLPALNKAELAARRHRAARTALRMTA